MPIYEFYSPSTNKIYTFFARSSAYADKMPRCPDGGDHPMEKLLSSFSVTGGSKNEEDVGGDLPSSGDDPFAGMNHSQMDAAMNELEKTVSSMDEESPDPRQMGQLMRRMAEMTGDKLDEGLEEVVRKLEEGADPDELEESIGDFLGEDADGMSGPDGEPEPSD
ncbi:MAG: FmdB family transcriptional regulator, partial [Opitutales bacterium]